MRRQMSKPYRAFVVTSTRADFGLLLPVINRLGADADFETKVVATGSHLVDALGRTAREIDSCGVRYTPVDIMGNDPARPVPLTMADALSRFSALFSSERPDIVVVLGDRYEMFSVVTAAAVCGVPVAHISGGETTEGAKDEFFRHCMTKMASLHFASAEPYRRRIIQLGEQPDTVVTAGALGAENILRVERVSRDDLSRDVDFDFSGRFLLCTFHPETMSAVPLSGAHELLAALEDVGLPVLFTAANADEGGERINAAIEGFCREHPGCKLVKSLGMKRYLSALALCAAAVGNSSSALVEAPTLRRPSVNVGERQRGRLCAASVVSCPCERGEIRRAIERALSPAFADVCRTMPLPFGGEGVSQTIVSGIKAALRRGISLKKSFYDIDFEVKEQ